MTKHVLSKPVRMPGAHIAAVALRRPTVADKDAILAELQSSGAATAPQRSVVMIARLADLPIDVVRKFPVRDLRALTEKATDLFAEAGMP